MKKSIRNFVLGAVMAASIFAASTAAMAGSMQYVQNTMNFRSGASTTAATIGSVPAGAQVEVLGSENGWNLIRFNGVTGYIHGGNVADTYTVKQAAPGKPFMFPKDTLYCARRRITTAATSSASSTPAIPYS